MQEVVLFYNGLDVPTRQILDSRGAIPSKTFADAKVAIQEMAEYSQKWHNGTSRTKSIETSDGLAVIEAKLNNLGREIKKVNEKVYAAQVGCEQCKGPITPKIVHSRKKGKSSKKFTTLNLVHLYKEGGIEQLLWGSTKGTAQTLRVEIRPLMDAAIRNQGASIKTLEIQIGQIRKVLLERGFRSLLSSTETNPRDHVKSTLTTVEAEASSIRRIGSHQYAVSTPTEQRDRLDRNSWKLTHMKLHISTIPYPKRRKTHEVSLYLAILIMFALIMSLMT
ncbi:hypothetical protein Tco_1287157 [Tanacetum coccineum]